MALPLHEYDEGDTNSTADRFLGLIVGNSAAYFAALKFLNRLRS